MKRVGPRGAGAAAEAAAGAMKGRNTKVGTRDDALYQGTASAVPKRVIHFVGFSP
jgi:hypothetical protein